MLTLNRLRPHPAEDVEAVEAYAYPASAYLRVNMVSSVDGAAALEGRVGALTGPADQQLLHLLRSLCDVLLVGAGTVRAEGYGPVRPLPALRDHRRTQGQLPAPRLAVLTRALDLDLDSSAFTEATQRPVVVTTEQADADRLRAARRVADVVVAGEYAVDLATVVASFRDEGLTRMLSEGGPGVLAALYEADLVDELCLAIAPLVACGHGTRITSGPPLPELPAVKLSAVHERDEFLFLRYTRG